MDKQTSTTRQWVYVARFPTRWRDLDDFGHVNSSVYFTYFEQARVMWWQSIGFRLQNEETGPVIITSECTFLKQLRNPAMLEVNIYVGPPGRSSYMMYYDICLENQPEILYATGSTKVVWVDYKKEKSIPLPDIMSNYLVEKIA